MLQDIPYAKIKENGRKYEVYILRNIYDKPWAAIAEEYALSLASIKNYYFSTLTKVIWFYVNHLSIIHGYETTNFFTKLWRDVETCYEGRQYVVAYFEKEYSEILREYRAGEPGMPDKFLKRLPPYRKNFCKRTISSIIRLREMEGLTFIAIGKRLRITREKAIQLYQHYYHKKFMNISDIIISEIGEKNLCRDYFKLYGVNNGKSRYESLIKDYPDFAD